MASWKCMTKIAGSGSGSSSQRHGSADPDPHQNVMDPQHGYVLTVYAVLWYGRYPTVSRVRRNFLNLIFSFPIGILDFCRQRIITRNRCICSVVFWTSPKRGGSPFQSSKPLKVRRGGGEANRIEAGYRTGHFYAVFRIRFRIDLGRPDPEPGGQEVTHKNRKKWRNLKFWSAGWGCSLLMAEGFSCSLDVLYWGLGISKFSLIKKS